MRLRTKYEVGGVPHAAHPRPQAARERWQCLNGEWQLEKLDKNGECTLSCKIQVPFSPETLNSGVEEGFLLRAGESLRYTRKLLLDESVMGGKTLLHFDAVDSACEVYLNGVSVGSHVGGFTAFCFDISAHCRVGENEIVVTVTDEATRNSGARGKQSDKRGGIWYTAQSGIWQTVWLEHMPKDAIEHLTITPREGGGEVVVAAKSESEIEITVFEGEREILHSRFRDKIVLSHDFKLWSPEEPFLYTMTLTNGAGDQLSSYFGVRWMGRVVDKSGKVRLALNGKPYFFNGVLDQGYWSDGMLTPPSDEAMADEIQLMKDMGFNTLRKHIKIEPMRWYYHCDRIGIAVWQDFVNGGGDYQFTHVAAFPFLGFHHKDSDYAYFAREDARGREEFAAMVDETISQLYNVPSILLWVPFNEGWGQFDSATWTAYVREKDPTRIIDSVSGWHDQGVGKTDLKSLHTYYTPLRVPKDPRPVVLSEFGGYSMQTKGHVFDEAREFGYKKFKTREALAEALRVLYLKKLKPLIAKGLCGAIYTQVSDVEEEINGFVTYDRRVQKVDTAAMREINDALMREAHSVQ